MLLNWTLPMGRVLDEWMAPANGHERLEVTHPAADLLDTGEEYRIVVEMPGVTKDGLEIELKDDVLSLRGKRPAPEKTERVLVDGRGASGVFERRFTLGKDIDREKIKARLENGLLTVSLPKRAEVKPQRIEIEVA